MELAAIRHATSATITDKGAAPPLNEIPAGMESAVAIAGAMNVMDWNSTPPKPTAPCRSPAVPPSSDRASGVVIAALRPGEWVGTGVNLGPHPRRRQRLRKG